MTQVQREALFDLLTLSLYADEHISWIEDDLLKLAFMKNGWESNYPKDMFIENSFARAREASEDDENTFDYLSERAAVFNTRSAQKEACTMLKKILESDGMTADESEFYSLFTQALPLVN